MLHFLMVFIVSDGREQVHADIQPGLSNSAARTLEWLPTVAGTDASRVPQQQLACHRGTRGNASVFIDSIGGSAVQWLGRRTCVREIAIREFDSRLVHCRVA